MSLTKKRVLWWSDSPTVTTGFGNVARNILKQLDKTGLYEFTLIGIAYNGDPHNLPWPIFPAQNAQSGQDMYGRSRLIDMLAKNDFDILFLLHDTFIVQTFIKQILLIQKKKKFKIVYYYPIDCTPKKDWIMETVSQVDFPVAYSQYGFDETIAVDPSLKNKLSMIHHGTDKKVFFPAPARIVDLFKKSFFQDKAESFIVLNVNRNQSRKDLLRTLEAFAIFHKRNPESFLYILAQPIDQGGNLLEIAEQLGLVWGTDWGCPPPGGYQVGVGISEESLNLLYNSADVMITSSLGEGWGLSTTESMATGLPVIVPEHTAFVEIIGDSEDRGTFCVTGGNDHFVTLGTIDNSRIRPVVDSFYLANRIEEVYLDRGKFREKAKKAIEWVPSWDKVGLKWVEIFAKAAIEE